MSDPLFARILGNVFGGALIFGIAYGIALAMRNRRGGSDLPKWPLIVGGMLALLSIVSSVTRTVYASQKTAPIKPMIVRQPAQGMTDNDFTREYAEEVREALVRDARANLPQGAGEVGGGSASVIAVGDRKVGVVRVAANGVENIVTVFGIRGDNLVRVTCVNDDGAADYREPECASAVKRELGVELP